MTDLEKLQNVFKELGIEFKMNTEDGRQILTFSEGKGYLGFYIDFQFDKKGKFIEYGIWE